MALNMLTEGEADGDSSFGDVRLLNLWRPKTGGKELSELMADEWSSESDEESLNPLVLFCDEFEETDVDEDEPEKSS